MSAKISNDRIAAIERLSRDTALTKGDLETALHKIGQLCAKSLNIEEVVFWNFSRDGNDLTNVVTHRVGQKTPVKPKIIRTQQIKSYINAIQN